MINSNQISLTKILGVSTICLFLFAPLPGKAQMVNDAAKLEVVPQQKPKVVRLVNKNQINTTPSPFSQNNVQNPGDQMPSNPGGDSSSWSPQGQNQQQSPFMQDPNAYNQNNGGYQNNPYGQQGYQNGQGQTINSVPVPKNALQR